MLAKTRPVERIILDIIFFSFSKAILSFCSERIFFLQTIGICFRLAKNQSYEPFQGAKIYESKSCLSFSKDQQQDFSFVSYSIEGNRTLTKSCIGHCDSYKLYLSILCVCVSRLRKKKQLSDNVIMIQLLFCPTHFTAHMLNLN